jgi:type II secretory ATPase GspE/PulE/Tfp pilus assembly ATPase PilB-like protein
MSAPSYFRRLPRQTADYLRSEAAARGLDANPENWPEPVFVAILCLKYNIPFVPIDPAMVDLVAFEKFYEACDKLHFLPVFMRGITMVVATAEPWSEARLRAIRNAVRLLIIPVGVLEADYERVRSASDSNLERMVKARPAPPPPKVELQTAWPPLDDPLKIASNILNRAADLGSSDVLISTQTNKLLVRTRVDGVYTDLPPLDETGGNLAVTGFKLLGGIPSSERSVPISGRGSFTSPAGKRTDVRVEFQPTARGDSMIMRLLDPEMIQRLRGTLPFEGSDLDLVRFCLERSTGLIIFTGPTGSGKTTTLYRCLTTLDAAELNIRTVEDPVEYLLDGIDQMQVKEREPDPHLRITWQDALRSQLRADPDVLLFGEMRDPECTTLTIQAALTGHLVLSTLHTNDATKAIPRLMDMGVSPLLVRDVLLLVIAQRLCAKLCPLCRIAEPTSPRIRRHYEFYKMAPPEVIYVPGGCAECKGRGLKGRTPIFELLHMNEEMGSSVGEGFDEAVFRRRWREKGGRTLTEHGLLLVAQGILPYSEVAQYETELL